MFVTLMYPNTPADVGLLVGGILGTFPALAVLGFVLWWCCAVDERHETTNGTPGMETAGDGVRPRIHEALIDESVTWRDGSHVFTWKGAQVSLFTQCIGVPLFSLTD